MKTVPETFLPEYDNIMRGYTYILRCANGKYYTGSTKNLTRRLAQHQRGEGANFTRKNLPVELIYFEVYPRIDTAFYREKQIQGWSRKKKEALMRGDFEELHVLAECRNETHYRTFRHRSFRLRSTYGGETYGNEMWGGDVMGKSLEEFDNESVMGILEGFDDDEED